MQQVSTLPAMTHCLQYRNNVSIDIFSSSTSGSNKQLNAYKNNVTAQPPPTHPTPN